MKELILPLLLVLNVIVVIAQETDSIIDIRDGQVYQVVKIGQQWWMQENLNIGTRIDGNQDDTDNGIIEKYCYYNNDSICSIYGSLYHWDEMMDYNPSDTGNPGITRGVCLVGWHLPTDIEWTELTYFLEGESIAGGKLKETGTTYWVSPNTGATNESGFSALPGGQCLSVDTFCNIGYYSLWWSSTNAEQYTDDAWIRRVDFDNSNIFRYGNFKKDGLYIRCLRDSCQYSYLTISDKNLKTIVKLDLINDKTVDTIIISSACSDKILNVTSIYTKTSLFTSNITSFYLLPGESTQLTVSFNAPERENYYYDTLYIESDDPFIPLMAVPITGYMKKDTIIDSRDGKVYKVVKIGQQWWMAENLNVGIFIESTVTGSSHSNVYDNGIIEKYCVDNLAENCSTYGGLYDWNEMMNYGTLEGTGGICPSGWHIPTDDEWRELEIYLGMDSTDTYLKGFRGTYEGLELKPGGSTGFNSLYTGRRNSFGEFEISNYCLWWTSSLVYDDSAYIRYWNMTSTAIGRDLFDSNFGHSVRCVEDPDTPRDLTLQDSLVAWYPFNGNANDESGNGYNGMVYGATLTTDRFGKNNSAFSFDGIDDYIKLPDKARFQPNTSYSVSFWLKTSQTSRFDLMDQRISFGSPDYYNFGIIGNEQNGQISFNFPQYSSSSQISVFNTNCNNDNWNNLLFIKDIDSNKMSIYMNGSKLAEKEFMDCEFTINGSLLIGKNYQNKWFFNGNFDNLRIYNRVLVENEIDSLYHEEFLINITSNINNVSCSGKTDGSIELTLDDEVAHYRFYWSTGDTTSLLDSLAPSEYSVSITDETNSVVGFETFMITEPFPVVVNTLDYNFIACFGDSSGEINLTAEGGTGNLQYSLSDDNSWQEYGLFTGLYAGKYIVSIMDENKCKINTDTITLEQNDKLSALDIVGKTETVEYELTSYSVSQTPGSQYEWFVTGGNITSGQNTNALTVHWTISGIGEIGVIETTADNCTGDTARLSVIISGLFNNKVNNAELQIIPNPLTDRTIIQFPNSIIQKYKLILTDLSGRVYKEIDNITSNELILERGDLPAGLYLVELRGPNIYRGKIIIE